MNFCSKPPNVKLRAMLTESIDTMASTPTGEKINSSSCLKKPITRVFKAERVVN